MRSPRILLIGYVSAIAATALLFGEVRKVEVATTDWRDLTVNGRGYICTVDQQNENPIWLRSIRLGINSNCQLCCQHGGELRPIESSISIPLDWKKVDISKDGSVTVSDPGGFSVNVGEVPLVLFTGDVNDEVVKAEDVKNRNEHPLNTHPGEGAAGHLDQYSARQYAIPITWRSVTSSIILGCAACYIVISWKSNMP